MTNLLNAETLLYSLEYSFPHLFPHPQTYVIS